MLNGIQKLCQIFKHIASVGSEIQSVKDIERPRRLLCVPGVFSASPASSLRPRRLLTELVPMGRNSISMWKLLLFLYNL